MSVTIPIAPVLAFSLAPLMLGMINRVKAWFAGRTGPPLLQTYYDLAKLLQKGAVYSQTTTLIFRAGPVVGLAAVTLAVLLTPLGLCPALISFHGDFVVLVCLLGLMRFVTVLAALDTGSSFEGMGASREVFFSALAEPTLLLGLAVLARQTHSLYLRGMFIDLQFASWGAHGPALALILAAWGIVFLTENARIPIDDPNTHLELTMIHEVMVLDHCGPDLALIFYGAALKLWILGSFLTSVAFPIRTGWVIIDLITPLAGMAVLALVVGMIEACMARLRLARIPKLLVGAGALAVLALVIELR